METIRPARIEDGAALRMLWADAGLEQMDADQYAAVVAQPSTIVLLAEDEGAATGVAIASFDGWRAQIYHVAVVEPLRHRGLAKELMAAAEKELRALGARAIRVAVGHDNPGGLALSYAMGYAPQDEAVLRKQAAD
ncbi:MAG: GNAT family N-acetyltransferase [Chloroflexi bacterium]|nr:GNAT family N-acetyltransferase [Chloroflexota bacterium]